MSRHLCLIFVLPHKRFCEYRASLVLMYACREIANFNVFMHWNSRSTRYPGYPGERETHRAWWLRVAKGTGCLERCEVKFSLNDLSISTVCRRETAYPLTNERRDAWHRGEIQNRVGRAE